MEYALAKSDKDVDRDLRTETPVHNLYSVERRVFLIVAKCIGPGVKKKEFSYPLA